jgi:hypothetical protein
MRSLSEAQALACEKATLPRCRCGDAFHGAGRTGDVRTLPAEDPHHPSDPEQQTLDLEDPLREVPTCSRSTSRQS